MNLPVVLEISLGLIFVYLILSLIASELQEILSTLFQWRAEHLKYSIEQLLAGNNQQELSAARKLADRIYASPALRSLNYEAQGPFARIFRTFLHGLGKIYRVLTRTRNIFNEQTSGPSYIPADAFAASLVENLQLDRIQKILTESRLKVLIQQRIQGPLYNIVNDLKASLGDEFVLSAELRHLEVAFEQILADYHAKRVNLAQTLDRLMAQLEEFADQSAQVLPEGHHLTTTFLRRLEYLRTNLTGKLNSLDILLKQIQPTLREMAQLLDEKSAVYREVAQLAAQQGGITRQMLERLSKMDLPSNLQESLITLADRAQQKTTEGMEGLQQLQIEVETWFNQGMDRATGVYKRNAKVVGILIGVAIAVGFNADTFHMIGRLSVDQAVRSSVVQSVEQLDTTTLATLSSQLGLNSQGRAAAPTTTSTRPESSSEENTKQLTQELKSLGDAVSQTLETYPLPLGRTAALMAQQAEAEAQWPLPIPRRWLGWLITGLAISMGSSFWFDVLRRVMSVRASGNKPAG